eukprot:gnl/MRDRNA2_/MRDRNA2_214380_c0_seq1.p1 gnl/MRDRNA2_/MRDRNA2_214380_c0~~gnl/MRDRNA2_/MRDRNA2_214380_c0_seq1.p1  ORF type:complete len:250 (+),score=44.55 gnl/MRDRNA2_/MRDRNA2_214380_c0_seq1:82-750(+)
MPVVARIATEAGEKISQVHGNLAEAFVPIHQAATDAVLVANDVLPHHEIRMASSFGSHAVNVVNAATSGVTTNVTSSATRLLSDVEGSAHEFYERLDGHAQGFTTAKEFNQLSTTTSGIADAIIAKATLQAPAVQAIKTRERKQKERIYRRGDDGLRVVDCKESVSEKVMVSDQLLFKGTTSAVMDFANVALNKLEDLSKPQLESDSSKVARKYLEHAPEVN